MNNYISAEEFLKQSEKVQKAFIEWWKPMMGDLIQEADEWDYINNRVYFTPIKIINKDINSQIKSKLIPLLQIHHLVQFIEDNGFRVCNIIRGKCSDNWCVRTSSKEEFNIRNSDSKLSLLQALWQVACEIAGKK